MAEQTQKKLGIAERLYTGQLSYDFMKARKFWFTFSAVLVALTLLVGTGDYNGAGMDVIRIVPALIVSDKQIAEANQMLRKAIDAFLKSAA